MVCIEGYRKLVSGSGSGELIQSADVDQRTNDWTRDATRIVYSERSLLVLEGPSPLALSGARVLGRNSTYG